MFSLQEFTNKSLRVMRVSYHPTYEELRTTATIAGAGMVIIGLIGLVITVIFDYVNRIGG